MLRRLYSILTYLAVPLLKLHLHRKYRSQARTMNRERLGHGPKLSSCIWLHAVSLGETNAAKPLIEAIAERFPQKTLLITHTTDTGAAAAQKLLRPQDVSSFFPFDTPRSVKRFIHRCNPEIIVVMETELWPNLTHFAHKRGIPLLQANARMSARSARGYRRMSWLTRPMLNKISHLAAQSTATQERFVQLGLPSERLTMTGNLKFELTPPEGVEELGQQLARHWGSRPTWIAASTHDGEESTLLHAHQLILKRCPNALLLIVPRHPQRFEAVYNLCEQTGMSVIRHSEDTRPGPATAIVLGDTMGEMMRFYAAANVAFIAGSLMSAGGHNLVEPAILAKPMITGPQLHNCREIAALLQTAGALAILDKAETIAEHISELLSNCSKQKEIGAKAQQAINHCQGACDKHLMIIEKLLCS